MFNFVEFLYWNLSHRCQRLLNPRHDTFFAENLEQVVEAGAGGFAGHGQTAGMHQHTGFHAQRLRSFLERGFQAPGVEGGGVGKGVAQLFQARFVLRHEIFFDGFGVVFNRVGEIEAGVGGQFAERFELALAGVQRGLDVADREGVGVHPGLGEGVDGEFVKTVRREFAGVFALEPEEFLVIEPRIVPENLRQIEAYDGLGEGELLAVFLGRPAEEAKEITARIFNRSELKFINAVFKNCCLKISPTNTKAR